MKMDKLSFIAVRPKKLINESFNTRAKIHNCKYEATKVSSKPNRQNNWQGQVYCIKRVKKKIEMSVQVLTEAIWLKEKANFANV